jgi:gliding motility-associated-like protein
MLRGLSKKIVLGVCLYLSGHFAASAQDFSSFGKSFYLSFPAHFSGAQAIMGIYITANGTASGTVTAAGRSYPFAIGRGEVSRIFLGQVSGATGPNTGIYLNTPEGITAGAAIRVEADAPVAVYQHIIKQFASGATLTLPVETWGSEYIVPGYGSQGNFGNGIINITAAEPATEVEIIPTANSLNGLRRAGVPYTINLPNPGDVYQVQFEGGADWSGTIVRAKSNATGRCNRFAVFSASTRSFLGCPNALGADNLLQQVFPTGVWGNTYIYVPFVNRQTTIYRIFARDSGTIVQRLEQGQTRTDTLPAGGFTEFTSATPGRIQANRPVLVVQYMSAQSCDPRNTNLCAINNNCLFPGNPEMIILNPTEQYLDSITLFSAHQNWVPPGESNVFRCFLNISIPTAAAASFRINGRVPTAGFFPVPGTGYSVLFEEVSSLAAANPIQQLVADSPFSCIAYGAGNLESYGYNAGTRFVDLKQQLLAQPTAGGQALCPGSLANLAVELPYAALRIKWLLGDSLAAQQVYTSPDSTFTGQNGRVNLYRLPNAVRLPATNTILIRALVVAADPANCSGEQEVLLRLSLPAAPKAAFTLSSSTLCQGDTLWLRRTGNAPLAGTTWQWDVGTGTMRQGDSLGFAYPQAGSYRIRHWASTPGGCPGDTAFATIVVNPNPQAAFGVLGQLCTGSTLLLTDSSSGSITRRIWQAQGLPADSSTTATKQVSFSQAGNYPVRLRVVDNNNCLSPATEQILRINPRPRAGFTLPPFCLRDATAIFDNTTLPGSGDATPFRWLWRYGTTGTGTIGPDSSVARTGTFRYTATGNYPVSLIATSGTGCADTLTQVFTVNGASPRAGFVVENGNPACSGLPVIFRNTSSVDFGRLTRLEWYWGTNPADTTTDLQPAPGGQYPRLFTLANATQPEQRTITLRVFSGISCRADTQVVVTVQPSPTLNWQAGSALCLNTPPFVPTNASLQTSLPGTGRYSGPGIDAGNRFDARLAGVGLQRLLYTYTTTAGCTDTVSGLLEVGAVPLVNAGPDAVMVRGGQLVLQGQISAGTPTQLQWLPPDGLSNPTALNPIARPALTTTYTLTASTQSGCTATDDAVITVLQQPVIPTAFSPNADGINDTWLIRGIEGYEGLRLLIFDRYGRQVHQATGSDAPWNGTYMGKPVPAGLYYYLLQDRAGRLNTKGSVTVIR